MIPASAEVNAQLSRPRALILLLAVILVLVFCGYLASLGGPGPYISGMIAFVDLLVLLALVSPTTLRDKASERLRLGRPLALILLLHVILVLLFCGYLASLGGPGPYIGGVIAIFDLVILALVSATTLRDKASERLHLSLPRALILLLAAILVLVFCRYLASLGGPGPYIGGVIAIFDLVMLVPVSVIMLRGKGSGRSRLSRRTRFAVDLALDPLFPVDRQRYREERAAELGDLPRRDRAPHVRPAKPFITPASAKADAQLSRPPTPILLLAVILVLVFCGYLASLGGPGPYIGGMIAIFDLVILALVSVIMLRGKASERSRLSRRTRFAVDLALRLLSPVDRQRYREEWAAELGDLPRRDQAPYAFRLLSHAWSLRRELSDKPPKNPRAGLVIVGVVIPSADGVAAFCGLDWPAAALGVTWVLSVLWVVSSRDRTQHLIALIREARNSKAPSRK